MHALVTGAGSPTGIGFATALMLGRMGATVSIAATGDHIHRRAAELRSAGVPANGFAADLAAPQSARSLVDASVETFGPVHIAVNNAGMVSTSMVDPSAERGSILTLAPDRWAAGIARNLDTAFHVSQSVLPHMLDQRWGRIVMVTSVTGPVMSMRDEPAYAAAKAGMVGLMRSIAVDFARDGITCNAVAPGWIATGSQLPHEVAEGEQTPVGRSAKPAEVAAAIAWLCTREAAYVTGQVLVVDGGGSVAEERALKR